jgi:F-type H+-transporting ATPase subunit b
MATEPLAADAGAHATGMPQLEFAHFPNQIFWLMVALVAIYFVLSRVALPRIASVLADRQGAIARDLAMAEDLKLKAVQAEDGYKKALADARTEANRIIAEARADIQKDLDAATARADAEISARSAEAEKRIGAIRDSAIASVEEIASATAAEIVRKLVPAADDRAAVQAAIAERMKG